MKEQNKLSASLEDYLETILEIVTKKQAARAKDIAQHLQVQARGLINYAPYDLITLTSEGERAARDVTRRHETLKKFFSDILFIDADEAEDGACKMEHAIPPKILNRLVQFADFVEQCPRVGAQLLQQFESFCRSGQIRETCDACLSKCLQDYRQKSKDTKKTSEDNT
jgi:DtxR family Mn-dependent transcriptional regulator